MTKYLVALCLTALPLISVAQDGSGLTKHCGEVQRTRTWVNPSTNYGIWVEFVTNTALCPSGFYLPEGDNKEIIYSTVLAAKLAKQGICFQVYPTKSNISDRCKINYTYHP